MGNTIDGSNYSNSTAPAPADSDDQSAQNFRAELLKQTSGKEQYAAAQDLAKHAREQYNQAHGGGSTIGNWWYNDRDYLSPAQQKLYDQAQHSSDVERAGDVSMAAVAARSAGDTATMGLTELGHDAATYEMGNKSWAENASENKENREAAERLHPWASRAGTVAGVAGWVAVGWESGAAKAVVSGGGAALRAAGAGAAMGALNGATHSDGSVREAATSAGISALVGGATGGLGAKATEVAVPYVSRLASNLFSTELRGGLKSVEHEALANISGGSANREAEATAAKTAASRGKGAGQGGVNSGSGEGAGAGGQATAHGPEATVPPSQPANTVNEALSGGRAPAGNAAAPGGPNASGPHASLSQPANPGGTTAQRAAAVNEPAVASGNGGGSATGPSAARPPTEPNEVSGQSLTNTDGNAAGIGTDPARGFNEASGGRETAGNAAASRGKGAGQDGGSGARAEVPEGPNPPEAPGKGPPPAIDEAIANGAGKEKPPAAAGEVTKPGGNTPQKLHEEQQQYQRSQRTGTDDRGYEGPRNNGRNENANNNRRNEDARNNRRSEDTGQRTGRSEGPPPPNEIKPPKAQTEPPPTTQEPRPEANQSPVNEGPGSSGNVGRSATSPRAAGPSTEPNGVNGQPIANTDGNAVGNGTGPARGVNEASGSGRETAGNAAASRGKGSGPDGGSGASPEGPNPREAPGKGPSPATDETIANGAGKAEKPLAAAGEVTKAGGNTPPKLHEEQQQYQRSQRTGTDDRGYEGPRNNGRNENANNNRSNEDARNNRRSEDNTGQRIGRSEGTPPPNEIKPPKAQTGPQPTTQEPRPEVNPSQVNEGPGSIGTAGHRAPETERGAGVAGRETSTAAEGPKPDVPKAPEGPKPIETRPVNTETPEIKAANLLSQARQAESHVTPALQSIAKANGGEMIGLEYRLKTPGSLTRKIAADPDRRINDALRYTMSFDEQNFAKGVQSTMKFLKAQGYRQTAFRNSFQRGESYMGINATYHTPKGEIFELQFHTPASFHMKDVVNHPLYEGLRVLPRGSPQREVFDLQMRKNSASVAIPPDASSIKRMR